jgi:MFS family permease
MIARIRSLSKRTRGELAVVLGLTTTTFIALSGLSPILPLYLDSLGVDPQLIGLMFAVMSLAFAAGEISWGWVIDRFDPRVALLAGTFVYALAISSFLLYQGIVWFFFCFFLLGLLCGPGFVMGRWYMGVRAPRSEKALSMAILTATIAGASSIGGFAGGLLAGQWGYLPALGAMALVPLIGGIVVLTRLRDLHFQLATPHSSVIVDMASPKKEGIPWHIKVAIAFGLISATQTVTFGVNSAFMALFATQVVGTNSRGVGLLFGMQGLIRFLVAIPIGRMADRRGKRYFASLGLAGMAISFSGVAFAPTYGWLLAAISGHAFFGAMLMSMNTAMLSERVPQNKQGLAMGILGLSEDCGMVVGSSAGGLFWEGFGPRSVFMFGGAILFIGLALWGIVLRSGILGEDFRATPVSGST